MVDKPPTVKHTAYMNFKDATDALFSGVSHADLAERLGVSVASIRQARLDQGAKAYRSAPNNWEEAVIRIAETQIMRYRKLIDDVRREGK